MKFKTEGEALQAVQPAINMGFTQWGCGNLIIRILNASRGSPSPKQQGSAYLRRRKTIGCRGHGSAAAQDPRRTKSGACIGVTINVEELIIISQCAESAGGTSRWRVTLRSGRVTAAFGASVRLTISSNRASSCKHRHPQTKFERGAK